MEISSSIALRGLGLGAIVATNVLLVLQIVLAQPHGNPTSSARISAIFASIFEAAALFSLIWLFFTSIRRGMKVTGLLFGCGLLLCIFAAVLVVVALICLSRDRPLHSKTNPFLSGASVVLVLTFATQLIYLVVHFASDRIHEQGRSESRANMEEMGRHNPSSHVRSIPYSRTSPSEPKIRRSTSMESRTPPPSSGGFSRADTMSSIRSTLSNAVRPISSRTRLLSNSQRTSRRTGSSESMSYRGRSSTVNDSFDSWDTSSVDIQNRQTVMASTSPPPGRLLETIPASPTTSRSPSSSQESLEPPQRQRRSRSFSPAASLSRLPMQPQRSFTHIPSSASESHIHPLFRSDSPSGPPPMVSPGTIVLASANAGRVFSDRESIRSLSKNRIRSGSLQSARSPLKQQGSFEDFARSLEADGMSLIEEPEPAAGVAGIERKITPPIPEWVLNAGSQTSLSGYDRRKQKESVEGDSSS